jgi:hypothetical protein
LRAVGSELLPESVEHLDRQAARIGRRLHHDRRHSADEHELGDAAVAVAGDIVRRLAAAGRVADVDRVAQVEMGDESRDVGGVVIHVMASSDLCRPAVAAPVMGDDAIALPDEVEHLRIPVVGAQGPAVMEHNGLGVLRAPVLVEYFDAVLGRDRAHRLGSSQRHDPTASWLPVRVGCELSEDLRPHRYFDNYVAVHLICEAPEQVSASEGRCRNKRLTSSVCWERLSPAWSFVLARLTGQVGTVIARCAKSVLRSYRVGFTTSARMDSLVSDPP